MGIPKLAGYTEKSNSFPREEEVALYKDTMTHTGEAPGIHVPLYPEPIIFMQNDKNQICQGVFRTQEASQDFTISTPPPSTFFTCKHHTLSQVSSKCLGHLLCVQHRMGHQ